MVQGKEAILEREEVPVVREVKEARVLVKLGVDGVRVVADLDPGGLEVYRDPEWADQNWREQDREARVVLWVIRGKVEADRNLGKYK